MRHEPLGRRLRKAIAEWCGIPMDLVQGAEVYDTQRGLLCTLEVPVRCRATAEQLCSDVDAPAVRRVLAPVMDYLAQGDKIDPNDRNAKAREAKQEREKARKQRGAELAGKRTPGNAATDVKASAKSPMRGPGAGASGKGKADAGTGEKRPSQLEMALRRSR